MKYTFNHIKPLLIFIIPTLVITAILFYFDTPSITIIIGFCVLLAAACLTYFLGIHGVLKEGAAKA
jgi:hypothetical protein